MPVSSGGQPCRGVNQEESWAQIVLQTHFNQKCTQGQAWAVPASLWLGPCRGAEQREVKLPVLL